MRGGAEVVEEHGEGEKPRPRGKTNSKKKDKREKKEEPKVETSVVSSPAQVIPKKEYVTDLDGFSAQELWDELKKRGYTIEGERIVKKADLQ